MNRLLLISFLCQQISCILTLVQFKRSKRYFKNLFSCSSEFIRCLRIFSYLYNTANIHLHGDRIDCILSATSLAACIISLQYTDHHHFFLFMGTFMSRIKFSFFSSMIDPYNYCCYLTSSSSSSPNPKFHFGLSSGPPPTSRLSSTWRMGCCINSVS